MSLPWRRQPQVRQSTSSAELPREFNPMPLLPRVEGCAAFFFSRAGVHGLRPGILTGQDPTEQDVAWLPSG